VGVHLAYSHAPNPPTTAHWEEPKYTTDKRSPEVLVVNVVWVETAA
jgi:hypothetical protein